MRLGLALLALACTDATRAQTILDFNVAVGDWTNAANWTPAQVPTAVDDAYIFGNRATTIDTQATLRVKELRIADSVVLSEWRESPDGFLLMVR